MKKNTLAAHNVRLLFWAELFGSVRFIQPVLTLFYFARGLDESLILMVLLVWSSGVLIGEIPTGMFADRYGAKKSFIIGSVLSIISHSLLLFAYDPWVFFISSFIHGFAVTFFSGADEALIYESLKESHEESLMDKAMGIIQSAGFIVMMIVVILGAIIAKDLTDRQFNLLIFLGVVFQIVQIFILFFIKNPKTQGSYQEQPFTQILDGIQAIKKTPQVLWMFMNLTLVFIPTAAVFEKFDQKILVEAGLPVYLIGIVYAIASLVGFTASRSIGWLSSKWSRIKWFYLTGGLGVGGLMVTAFLGHILWVVLIVIFLLRFVNAVRYPLYSQLSNDLIPSKVRATTISILSIFDSVCDIIIFMSLAGIAVSGLSTMLLASAFIAMIGIMIPVKSTTSPSNT